MNPEWAWTGIYLFGFALTGSVCAIVMGRNGDDLHEAGSTSFFVATIWPVLVALVPLFAIGFAFALIARLARR